jgi:hypothetical protein
MAGRDMVDCHWMMNRHMMAGTRKQHTPFKVFEAHWQGRPSPFPPLTLQIGSS